MARASQVEMAVSSLVLFTETTIAHARNHLEVNAGSLRLGEYAQLAAQLSGTVKRCALDADLLRTTLTSVRTMRTLIDASITELAHQLYAHQLALSPVLLSSIARKGSPGHQRQPEERWVLPSSPGNRSNFPGERWPEAGSLASPPGDADEAASHR